MWKGRFSQETTDVVRDFTQSLDIDWCLAEFDIQGSIAHVCALAKAEVIPQEDAAVIRQGLLRILDEIRSGDYVPSVDLEDVHMNIEHRLTELTGAAGARLHTGRSRNDQVATSMRLFLRDRLLSLGDGVLSLLDVLTTKAQGHRDVIVPGYTHVQQAQPITMGHYWMAHFEAFRRDFERLLFALDAMKECPLGAGALAGSTLPLDRGYSASLLGFDGPTRNSLDSVGQRDYIYNYHSFAAMFAVHASRLSEDLVLYSSQEFGWLLLPDAFCTGSSMMPQKKNPDILELVRGKTGQIIGHLIDLLVSLKGLPMTYDRDLQEDKRGMESSLGVIASTLAVLPPLLSTVEIDGDRAVRCMSDGLVLATDIAEYLVRRGVPFRDAHWKVGKVVRFCLDERKTLFDITKSEWMSLLPEAGGDLGGILSLRASVERRATTGGTAPSEVGNRIEEARKDLLEYNRMLGTHRKRREHAAQLFEEAVTP
jgi:argininosuccinate lyase